MKPFVGVDLGGTNLRAAVVDTTSGRVLAQQRCLTQAHEGQAAVTARMTALIETAMAESGCTAEQLGGLGVGVPGTPDIETGLVRFLTNLPGQWRDVPLAALLSERLGLAAVLINDVRAVTLAEWRFGAGRGADTLACLAIGTGIGGGLVVKGRLHLGLGGTAGEFGHQVVDAHGPPCGCGGRGCLELYASGPAIAAQAAKAVLHGHTTRLGPLCGYDLNRLTAQVVVEAAAEGDAAALDILARAGQYLGIAVANIITAVSPEKILFGGGVGLSGDWLIDHVRRVIVERVHVVDVSQVRLVRAALGDEAGPIGAAVWAQQRLGEIT
jgi:glucokinase